METPMDLTYAAMRSLESELVHTLKMNRSEQQRDWLASCLNKAFAEIVVSLFFHLHSSLMLLTPEKTRLSIL
jgi:hypothetical protein